MRESGKQGPHVAKGERFRVRLWSGHVAVARARREMQYTRAYPEGIVWADVEEGPEWATRESANPNSFTSSYVLEVLE